MAADASIYAQFRRPVRSMSEYAADYDAAEGNALQLAAKRMQMQQSQRAMADEDAIRGLARQHGGDENALIRALRTGGYFDKAGAIEKSIGERLKAKSDLDTADATRRKTEAETESKRLADAKTRLDLAGQVFGFVRDNPSLENGARAADYLAQNGIWTREQAQAAIQQLQQNPTPEAIRSLAALSFQSALDAKEQLPKYFQQSRGGTTAVVGVNPVTGEAKDLQTATLTQTPDSVASNARMVEEGRLNRGVTMRGQNMADARARDQFTVETGGPSQAGLAKQLGKAPPGYRWKPDGGLESIPGGPADIKAGEAGAKASAKRDAQIAQAEGVLGTISDAKKLTGYTTAGVGGVLARVPATDARNLQSKLETVKANLGFDRLQQMRDNSPTGGALGAVAVQELVALQSTVASLDQMQSPKELGAALEKIERHYTRWLDVMKQAPGGGEGGASGGWETKKPKAGPVDFGSLK